MQPQFVNIGEKAQRSAPEGRDITRHLLSPPVGCADSPLPEGALQRFALLGRTESSAPTRFVRDIEDAVPYGMVGGVCQGRTPYDAKCPGASRGRDTVF